MLQSITEKLAALGLNLPAAAEAKGNYLPYTISGNLLSLSGTLPIKQGALIAGRIGGDLSVEQGYEAARWCFLNALAHIRVATDDFRRFGRVLHIDGFVNGVDGFADAPKVVNGASDLSVELFGDAGKHSRVALSSNGLPLNAAVETRVLVELDA
ncbi:RidA family protein [Pelagicoccus sp. SDUM812003]|uniref:RidA family protein n=1 Tax=Pelagicoccus sp. SDUM812003 TaxID=3041267 RepID=UPI0028104930|nr:RidA family protein [Pelagicoccus sp. SDUM812003]MDQ8205402.1 RidA family protein [Pelagicoccus sp. SDUM812003]